MKNSQPVVLGLCSVFAFATGVLSARTLAWYRFEVMSAGDVTTSSTTFTNTVDETKYPAYVGVCNFGGNDRYAKSKLVYTADMMPYGTNAFPSSVALVNRQDSSRQLANNGALALNMTRIKNSPHAQLFIDDDEDLRLQTFTLEFFARIPDTAEGWRSIVCRCGGKYTDARTTFNLYASVRETAAKEMYVQLKASAVENPLYDANGLVTNQTVYTASSMSSYNPLDNDKWHHFAIVVDGAQKKLSVYIDYAVRGSLTYSGDLYYEPGYPFAFGGHPQCTYFSSTYSLDEVRISDEVLAPSQMLGYEAASQASPGVVDDSTLLYFPFAGGTETVTVGADEMQTPVSYVPYLKNQAVNPQFSTLSAVWNTSARETDEWELSSEVQGSPVRFGLRARESQANETAIHLMTNPPLSVKNGSDSSQTMATTLFGDSCTVEYFFKMSTSGYCGMNQQTHLFGIYSALAVRTLESSQWDSGCLQVTVGSTTLTSPASGNAANYANKARHFNDGKWHHMAIVSDRTNRRADCYVDYEWSCGADDVVYDNIKNYVNGYINGLVMGGSYWGSGRPMGDFRFDEVRVTRGALRPHQFLTTKAVESDLLGRATFDENLIMTPYTNAFGVAGTAAKFTGSGSVPTFANDVPARTLTAGKDGEVVVEKNSRSLVVDGGKVTWAGRRLLADTDEFTVEFFVKAASATAGAGLMRVNRASESDVTSDVTWALSFADSGGGLRLKVDTVAATAQTYDFAAAIADGKWHHVGIQFACDGDDTKVSLYKDAAKVGEWTAEGRLVTNPRLMNFMVGAGEDATAGFTGFVDELRVSPGIVAAAEFLTPKKSGGILILR